MHKILISDPLSPKGLAVFEGVEGVEVTAKKLTPEELLKEIPEYDALIIRSGTQVTAEVLEKAEKLKVIGRAGVGVDNVDKEAASKKGVIVMNTPGGNTISTAEQTLTLMLALSRNTAEAVASVKRGEWERKKYVGTEVFGKTLGLIGLGRVGYEVCKRAQAFGMKVIAYDPFAAKETATKLGIQLAKLAEVIKEADYLTVHTPKNDETTHMISTKEFEYMKDGVRIINCARGGIIDEAALAEALKSGKVAGAALDVYEQEPPDPDNPLLKMENVVATPHLGASTEEAQENVGVQVAHQVLDFLVKKKVVNAINFPSIEPDLLEVMQPFVVLAEKMGAFIGQIVEDRIFEVHITYIGELNEYPSSPLTSAILKGLLSQVMEHSINYVNAPYIAKDREIKVIESKSSEHRAYSQLIDIKVVTKKKEYVLDGTLFANNAPRFVHYNGFNIEAVPDEWMLIIRNKDVPGVIGHIGGILANHKINIADMSLGRKSAGGEAMTILNIDEAVSEVGIDELKALEAIIDIDQVKV